MDEDSPMALEYQATEEFSAALPSEDAGSTVSPSALASSMSILAAMFLTACIFMVAALYCDRQKRNKYYQCEWNKTVTAFAVPWQFFPMRNIGVNNSYDVEKRHLISKNSIINMYTSKNKADTKYEKIKRKFPYFVTIPEEDEDEHEIYKIQQ